MIRGTIGGKFESCKVSHLSRGGIYEKVVTNGIPLKMPTSNTTALNFIKNGMPKMSYQLIVHTLVYIILHTISQSCVKAHLRARLAVRISNIYQFLLGNSQIKAPGAYTWRGYYKRRFCVSNFGVLYSGEGVLFSYFLRYFTMYYEKFEVVHSLKFGSSLLTICT